MLWKLLFRWDFYAFGKNSTILRPMRIQGARWIGIGDKVIILSGGWLLALEPSEGQGGQGPKIEIGDGTYIGHFCHIVSMRQVRIGKKVLIADRVYVSDNTHSYEDIDIPVIDQQVRFAGAVEIGDGSWIGENACIIGAKIGKHCVIAANAVVTKDVPDFCVVGGVPGRILKRFEPPTGAWVPVREGRG